MLSGLFFSCVPFSTLRPVRRLALLFTGRYVSRGEVRFRTPPGCECDLLLVVGLEKLTSVRLDLRWHQRVRARLVSRCDFVSKPCWASRRFYFLCFIPLSSNSGTGAWRAAQGFGPWAREWSASPKSAFAMEVRTLDVKQRLARIRAKSFAARSTAYKGILVACPRQSSPWSSVTLLVFYSSAVRPGLVTLLWPRRRGFEDPTTGSCGD